MAALTKDRDIGRKAGGMQAAYPVKAGAKIFAGGSVCVDANGYAVPGSDTAGLKFVGVSRQYVDNTYGQNGDLVIEVWIRDIFNFEANGLTDADVGKPVFIVDDQTVALSSTNGVGIGIITEMGLGSKVWVDIAPANRRTGQAQASVTAADGVAAVGAAPTKAEYDAVVTLANSNKAVINGLLTKLKAAGIIGS